MDDEQLRRELERRANRASVPDLLPAVSRRLDDRPAPARVARWAPLAGLAGAAVILLALIFALPHFEAGPSASTIPLPSRVSAANYVSPSPGVSLTPTSSATAMAPANIPCVAGPMTPTGPRQTLPVVIDETGLVESCAGTDYLIPSSGDITVGNPFGDDGLEVVLVGRPCIDFMTLTFRRIEAGYDLIASVACESDVTVSGGAFYITLREPVDANSVIAHVADDGGLVSPPVPPPSPSPTPSITPQSDLTPRQRIDRFWEPFGDVGCVGMGASASITQERDLSDLVVIGRPLSAEDWPDSPYQPPNSLIVVQVSKVLKGEPDYVEPGVILLSGNDFPLVSVSDFDHVLFLSKDSHADQVYDLAESYLSVYANVDGRVVTPEYRAIKDTEGNDFLTVSLDGTSFDQLLARIEGGQLVESRIAQGVTQNGTVTAC